MMSDNQTQLMKAENPEMASPVFVEAEKMFDKLAEITKETAARAYDFFVERGAQMGTHLEDWLRAEAEMLRAAPAKITETKKLVKVQVAVPGFNPDEIEVSVKDNVLIISGETVAEEKSEDENTVYNEWHSDRFLRKLDLPDLVETDDIKALLKDGVLKLTLSKKAVVEATKVAVQSA